MQVGGELVLAILLLVGLFLQCFCVVASNCLCSFSSTLTDVHMDASTKLATFPLEEEVLTSISPNMSDCVGYIFNILGGLFHYVKIISSFKLLFKFISLVHIISRRVLFGSVYER